MKSEISMSQPDRPAGLASGGADAGGADALFAQLAVVFESRKTAVGSEAANSYVAGLLAPGRAPDAFLKKIGEEAAEVVMAAKDIENGRKQGTALVAEVADLWFHTLVALSHYGFSGQDVVAELERREGLGGLQEKAARPRTGG